MRALTGRMFARTDKVRVLRHESLRCARARSRQSHDFERERMCVRAQRERLATFAADTFAMSNSLKSPRRRPRRWLDEHRWCGVRRLT